MNKFWYHLYRRFMNLHLYSKVIIIYIVCILIPTFSLGAVVLNMTLISVQKQQYENEQRIYDASTDTIDTYLGQAAATSYYFVQSSTIEPMLRGEYKSKSDTIFHYLRDIEPLINASRLNSSILEAHLFGFREYQLNIDQDDSGFSSINESRVDEAMMLRIKKSSYGLWHTRLDDDTMVHLDYYRYILSNEHPYDLGIIKFEINLPKLISTVYKDQEVYLHFKDQEVMIQSIDEVIDVSAIKIEKLLADNERIYRSNIGYYPIEVIVPLEDEIGFEAQFGYVAIGIIIMLFVFSSLYFFFINGITKRLREFSNHIVTSDAEQLAIYTMNEYNDEIGMTIGSYNKLVERINLLIHENYHIQLQNKDARFYALQAQINPHFLFNVLENIRMSSIRHDDEITSAMIHVLGEFIRYNLKPDENIISLVDELRHARTYLKIHQIRLGDALSYDIGAMTEIDDIMCPRFIVQPLIENSLKHGMAEAGSIQIRVRVEDDFDDRNAVRVTISDDGVGMSDDMIRNCLNQKVKGERYRIGLKNVDVRLKSFSGNRLGGLKISSEIGIGTSISFLLERKKNGVMDIENSDRRG